MRLLPTFKMAINRTYKTISLYLDGNMVKLGFGSLFLMSVPKNTLRVTSYRTNVGYVFEQIRSGQVIAIVSDYTQVTDSTGTPYAGTFDDVLTQINTILG